MAVVKDKAWLESLCRSFTEHSITVLGGYVTSDQAEPDLKLRAIGILLDRGWGRPMQDNTHTLSGEVRVVLRKMLEDEKDNE